MHRSNLVVASLRWTFMLAATVILASCGGKPDVLDAEPTPGLTVNAIQPVNKLIERQLVVSGSVAAWQEMSLGVELSGIRVAEVLVDVGDEVKAGQVLLRLDSRTLLVQDRQSAASLEQARANLVLAQAASGRGDALLERNLISNSDHDQLKANLINAEAMLATAEADREASRLRLSFSTLVAPHAGTISARTVEPGQVVSAGSELLRLIRDNRLEWQAELAERDFAMVRENAVVTLSDPDGASIRGRIRAVAPALDPQRRTGLIYADLPQPGSLRAGMFAEGRILLGSEETTMLPRESIVYRDGRPYVFILNDIGPTATVTQQRISIGIQHQDMAEVTNGLEPGIHIVGRGAGFLSDGDLVRLAPLPEPLEARSPQP